MFTLILFLCAYFIPIPNVVVLFSVFLCGLIVSGIVITSIDNIILIKKIRIMEKEIKTRGEELNRLKTRQQDQSTEINSKNSTQL